MIRTEGGRFAIQFDNGYILSCFNGYGSYTENHFNFKKQTAILEGEEPNVWTSKEVEIAIIYENNFVTQNVIGSNDSVKTVTINELIKIINKVSKL